MLATAAAVNAAWIAPFAPARRFGLAIAVNYGEKARFVASQLTSYPAPDKLIGFTGLMGCSTETPVKDPPDDRSPLAVAMEWTSRVTAISLEMALPALVGYWADRQLGTGMVLLVLGAILGFGMGMWHLVKLSRSMSGDGRPPRESSKDHQ